MDMELAFSPNFVGCHFDQMIVSFALQKLSNSMSSHLLTVGLNTYVTKVAVRQLSPMSVCSTAFTTSCSIKYNVSGFM